MPIKYTTYDDGITKKTYATVELRPGRGKHKDKRYLPLGEAEQFSAMLKETFGAWGYEFAIEGAERYWRAQPSVEGTPEPLTRAWYREKILHEIDWVRKIVALRDTPENLNKVNLESWMLSAMNLGALLEDAVWRFGQGDHIRLGHRIRVKNRASGLKGVDVRRENSAQSDRRLDAAVRECKEKHPDWKRRAIAANLVGKFGRPFDSERTDDRTKAVNALVRKIARREK